MKSSYGNCFSRIPRALGVGIALASILMPTMASAQNLLTVNPSFEAGTPGGGNGVTSFTGWTFNYFRYDGWGTITNDATDGTNSMNLGHGGLLTTAAANRVSVTPSVVYQLGFDAKTTQDSNPSAFNGIIPSVLFYDVNGNLIHVIQNTADLQAGVTSDWTHYILSATAPAGAVTAGVQVLANSGSYPNEDARLSRVDNFTLVAVPEFSDTVRIRSAPTLVVPGQTYPVKMRYTATQARDIGAELLLNGSLVASNTVHVNAGRGVVNLSITIPTSAGNATNYQWNAVITPTGGGFGGAIASITQNNVLLDETVSGSTTIDADNADIRYSGRIDQSDPKNVVLYWGGSQVFARFQGTSCQVRIATTDGEPFVATVDGVINTNQFTVTGGIGTAASGLADGEHTIVITKNNENDHWATFQGFILDSGKGLLPAAPLPARRIESYGDSITSGGIPDLIPGITNPDTGNDGDYNSDWEHTYLAYTGRCLGADYRPISKGGTGVSGSYVFNYTLLDYWDKLNFDGYTPANATTWDFSQWTPDAVIVAIGQNDQFRKPDEATFVTDYQQFVHDVRAKYPNAEIFCTNTTMGNNPQWKDAVLPLLASDQHLHFNMYPTQNHGGHPRLQEHQDMAMGSGTDSDPSSYDLSWYSLAQWIGDVLDYGTDPIGSAAYFAGTTPFGQPIPGTIEAESYNTGGEGIGYHDSDPTNDGGAYRNDGVDIEDCSEGGYDVGWTTAGEWLKYSVVAASAGTYTLTVRYAGTSDGSIHIEDENGNNLTGSIPLISTGGWQTWQSTTASLTLAAGYHTLKLVEETGGFNLNYLNFASANFTNQATNGTASASNNPVAAEVCAKAFDGTTSTKWLGTTSSSNPIAWLQYQFGSGASYAIKQYKISSANDTPNRDPKSWTVCGSNDGSTWTTLDTQTNQSFSDRYVTNTYNIGNSTAYKYYRLNITANSGNTDTTLGGTGMVQLSEFQLLK